MESSTATAPTASISQATSNESSSPGLPVPNIIGIAIACFFILLCLVLLGRWLFLRRKRARGAGRKSVVWTNGGKSGAAEAGASTVRMVHHGGSASTQHLPPERHQPPVAYPAQSAARTGHHEPTTPRSAHHPTTPTYATQSYGSRNPYATRAGSERGYAYPK
ncbi:hypothetical protein ACGC1H_005314 [Rhizoctonia solani]|uniref:Transmembrane protein n=1 Tax=Rhizoctonia solani TaxID=456999 RepID=A0A8H3GWB4_9AGAM|nr:unnamed protein product [Rhizoctonia solani]